MDTFPFTKKKLLQQPPARRHKLISQWLRQIHEKLLKESLTEQSRKLFKDNYILLLEWIGENIAETAQVSTHQQWIEFVSDRFHHHKKLSGIGIAEHDFLPSIKTGDSTDRSPWEALFEYKVALDNLRSAFNVGSIFRIADAAGFESVITGNKTPGKENRQVTRTSMGCTDWIPEEKQTDLAASLKQYKESGYSVLGIETIEESDNHLEFNWPEKGIVVLGNEEYGLSEAVLKICDSFIYLPMYGRKNSINVANAFSVIAFHIAHSLRQRQ